MLGLTAALAALATLSVAPTYRSPGLPVDEQPRLLPPTQQPGAPSGSAASALRSAAVFGCVAASHSASALASTAGSRW